ncbi:MAG: RNA polymerase sigma-70 factor, partial [Tannerella sp.]|nr:RNA polymerase sigma-70 factor [Tannerella sp.]
DKFKDIYNVHFDAVRRFVFYRCGDKEEASDVAQDVFMKVWENRDAFDTGTIKPILYRLATSYFVDNYRKQMSRMNFEQGMKQTVHTGSSPEDELSFKELTAVYERILAQMPDKQRTIYLMSREKEMKYAEIADRLQISVKAVEKHISAAIRLLKSKFLIHK